MTDGKEQPHSIERQDGRFRVLDEAGRVLLSCLDEGSATHYVVLLNEAYRRGYKAGYRAAKKP